MPYTNAPATVPNDALKFLVGDVSTSASGELLSTGECAYLIAQYGSARAAGPNAARAIAAQYALQADKQVGDLRISSHQKFDQYMALAKTLERTAALGALPYAGGISVGDKLSNVSDSDRREPAFRLGMHDNPRVTMARST